jgi:hypothetical protein
VWSLALAADGDGGGVAGSVRQEGEANLVVERLKELRVLIGGRVRKCAGRRG